MDDGSSIEIHLLAGPFLRVCLGKDLLSYLSKLADGYLCNFHLVFSLVVLKEIVLVALEVIEIVMLLRFLIGSLASEDKIDPAVQGATHFHALQGLAHLEDEFLRRTCPHWQHHCIHILSLLLTTEVDSVPVPQKLSPIVKLGS